MARIRNENDFYEHQSEAQNRPEVYWGNVANEFTWMKPWKTVCEGSFKNLDVKWFTGGTTNMTVNCLDRHLDRKGDKPALKYVANDPSDPVRSYTFKEVHAEVCRLANGLKSLGVKRGDRVCFYMGMTPELMFGLLACARIGAVHSVVFGGFSAQALAQRINDCRPNVVVTHDGGLRGNKVIPLKEICDQALEQTDCVSKVVVSKRAQNFIQMKEGRDLYYEDLVKTMDENCPAEEMDSEDPLFILYTSGSTGKPKGLLHTTGGYMTYVGHSFRNVFQMEEDDLYWCTADIGWITGHSYLTYGPLLNASTTVMFEGVPTYPDAGRFWDEVDRLKVTHFYTAPTAIRALEAAGTKFVENKDLSSLKVLGTVGEPINQEAWEWYHNHVGRKRCPIVDTWWQTETGGIMISNLANVTKEKATYATHPLPGVQAILVDEKGNELTDQTAEGLLCIKTPWPSIARTIYGDNDRYRQTYFSTFEGLYFTGDGARRDEHGLRITGRVDDVINVSGHRIGTAEVEDALNQHEAVVESAVVGFPHSIKGQGIYAYVILAHDISDPAALNKELLAQVQHSIGPIAKPDSIQIVRGLPKTRSGKIMRRILRKVASNDTDQMGDTSTLLNPEIVDHLIEGRNKNQ